jgi:hypothetical protein
VAETERLGASLRKTRGDLGSATALVAELKAQLHAHRGELRKRKERLDALLASTSWRITRPFRGASRLLRKGKL